MAIRTGMENLIDELRGMTNAGTADATVAGVAYWSDQQLQDTLDRYARQHNSALLEAVPDDYGGSLSYTRYQMPHGRFEERTDGTAIFRVTDAAGSVIGTAAYSVNYMLNEITFTANTEGSARYLSGRTYEIYRAAADVWAWKSAHVAERFDVQTDNHKLSRSQMMRHAHQMAQFYRNEALRERLRAGQGSVRIKRVDAN